MHSQDYKSITLITVPEPAWIKLMQTVEAMAETLEAKKPDAKLTVEQAAEYCNVSTDTIYTRKSEIGHIKLGGKILFKKSDLDRWQDSYYQKPRTGKSLTVQSRRTG